MRNPHGLALLIFVAVSLFAQESTSSPARLEIRGLASKYGGFQEIKPTLVNNGAASVYLSRFWPNGSAQLQRFNDANGQWESGAWGITCATVANATEPIEA